MGSLSRSDPRAFKQRAAEVEQSLKDAAGRETGADAQALTRLAAVFGQAAQSGRLDAPAASASDSVPGARRGPYARPPALGASVDQALSRASSLLDGEADTSPS